MARSWIRLAFSLAMVAGLCLVTSSAFAQPGGGRGQGGPGGGFGGPGGFGGGFGGPGGGGALGLLQNEDVRKELDLVDDQIEKLNSINEKLREDMRNQFQGLRDLSDDERRSRFDELRTKMQEQTAATQKEIDDVLLPQQRTRLAQIQFQQQLRRGGGDTTGLTSDVVVEALEITPDQKSKLEDLEKEVAKEIADKVAKARADARDKLLGALTPEQKAKFKELMGVEFRFSQPQQGRGPGQGGFGGQGGQGGQGGRGQGGQGGRGQGGRGQGNRGI